MLKSQLLHHPERGRCRANAGRTPCECRVNAEVPDERRANTVWTPDERRGAGRTPCERRETAARLPSGCRAASTRSFARRSSGQFFVSRSPFPDFLLTLHFSYVISLFVNLHIARRVFSIFFFLIFDKFCAISNRISCLRLLCICFSNHLAWLCEFIWSRLILDGARMLMIWNFCFKNIPSIWMLTS